VTQAYDAKATVNEATAVTVAAGSVTPEVNAAMVEGAELSGTVTDASTGAGVEGAIVCAANAPGTPAREGACTVSGAGGAFTIIGVGEGKVIIIAAARGLLFGSYGGSGAFTEAAAIAVVAGERRGDLDIALGSLPTTPGTIGSGAPPGTSPGNNTLSGSGASPLSGDGIVPTGTGAPSAGVGLANSSVESHDKRNVVVRLSCSSNHGCSGRLVLSAKRTVRWRGHVLRKIVMLGSARFETKGDNSFAVTVALNRVGRRMLAARKRFVARVRIVQQAPGPAETTIKRVLILAGRRRRLAR